MYDEIRKALPLSFLLVLLEGKLPSERVTDTKDAARDAGELNVYRKETESRQRPELESKPKPGLKSKAGIISGSWLTEPSVDINDEKFDFLAGEASNIY
ncbi:hypothetical protein EVAR_98000_1 [Eumeta japonica]|uniref:Uncharacterized protein n=1 Tax=Eumeta variegata TaxID=151549 RepID=A0A4C1WIA5_EUMVA|nr:hypothetical protein EVAR_98000_1 [Eumeta japonica]